MPNTVTKSARPLAEMRVLASELADALRQSCERIEVAGSVRRQKPECGDIEVVAIPRFTSRPDLYGEGTRNNELWQVVDGLGVAYSKRGEKYRQFAWRGVQIDLFTAARHNWGWILLVRTGSADFSRRMAVALNAHGYTSRDGVVRRRDDSSATEETPEESDVFRLAGMEWVPPELRG
mgnify:CR=1 FL=1